mmetsp:Transcript_21472/g.36872  ORF Transcript_21472/g.36872 Transcript_21472/m.36872 type:complete len:431 (-) Transcript_21472:1078-2370(-)|eukprot:CAMPEP_0183730986 /NCGR_PEP_ID=MMETSP0737-20130205/34013_1 /TAXON_ID=385413 /ORGANISM="Thalassiosira miniscula, Strain CCMP1093" /LENGTH=430 /DNA_ID=CAMNT_0025963597 /DNA_START=58 /DNA_END=1350 /DNA_ORIENTATION=-
MARRGTTKKSRATPREQTRSGYLRNVTASSPAASLFFDDEPDKIQFFGVTIPNPLSLLRNNLSSSPVANWSPTRILLVGGIAAIVLAPLFDTFIREALALLRGSSDGDDNNGIIGDALPHVTNDGKFHGRYPNSLLTLFYPYTLYRDVVLDQPVSPDDVPFYWHAHVSDERAVKSILTKCYEADLVELNTIEDVEKAKRLNLVATLVEQDRVGIGAVTKDNLWNGQRRKPLVIASPFVSEAAELFSQDNFGRTFSFYRHPIDYDVHPNLKKKLPPEAGANNFMTRLLSGVHTGELGYKELGIGKQVIRQTTIAGTRDLMAESMFRFGKYYGWVPVGGEGTKESEESDDQIAQTCINEVVKDVPGERYADHNSPEWKVFYKANKLDCQLYEIARSTWRAQIQTIISLPLQKQRAGEGDDDEKEDEEEEEEE